MLLKVLEIRDRGTCIPVVAIKMLGEGEVQRHYLWRAGFPEDGSSVTLMVLYDQKATNDPYEWSALGMGDRTMQVAHDHVLDRFDDLSEGDVVDVELILGESKTKKVAERFSHPTS